MSGGIFSLIFPSSNSLYIAVQHFRKIGATEELVYWAWACEYLESRGLVIGKMADLYWAEWQEVLENVDRKV
jgi:hypothetical protein